MKMKRILCAVLAALSVLLCVIMLLRGRAERAQLKEASLQEAEETLQPVPESTPGPTPEPTPEPAFPAGVYFGKHEQIDEVYGNQYLEYCVKIPQNSREGMPLIVYLHGDNLITRLEELPKSDIAYQTEQIYGDEFPFILLMPNTREPEWFGGWIGPNLKGLIDEVSAEYRCSDVVITGYSRGAIAVWQLVEKYGTYFSKAVPVSCWAGIHGENFVGVPVWALYGDAVYDSQTYGSSMRYNVELITAAGGDAKYSVLENSDHPDTCYSAYSREVFEWMTQKN